MGSATQRCPQAIEGIIRINNGVDLTSKR